jgi:hypothetical protein
MPTAASMAAWHQADWSFDSPDSGGVLGALLFRPWRCSAGEVKLAEFLDAPRFDRVVLAPKEPHPLGSHLLNSTTGVVIIHRK